MTAKNGNILDNRGVNRSLTQWSKGDAAVSKRLQDGILLPAWRPRFDYSKDQRFFAIGSCFARNLEIALSQAGLNIKSIDDSSPYQEIRSNMTLGLLNQYNPVSIQQELEWAIGLKEFPADALIKSGNFTIDLFMRDQAPKGNRDAVLARRAAVKQYFAGALDVDHVIITLGLIETWFDRHFKLAINGAPSPRLVAKEQNRFGMKILTAAECVSVLNSICELIKTHSKRDTKITFTVSPVAMQRTFSNQDIVVANTHSKSTLRAAAGELVMARSDVDYFPSYEAAMMSDPAVVWQKNRREVSDKMVYRIIDSFLSKGNFDLS